MQQPQPPVTPAAQPPKPREAQGIQAPGKKQNPRRHEPACPKNTPGFGQMKRNQGHVHQSDPMKKVVLKPCLVDGHHLRRDLIFKDMCTESAHRHRQKSVDAAQKQEKFRLKLHASPPGVTAR